MDRLTTIPVDGLVVLVTLFLTVLLAAILREIVQIRRDIRLIRSIEPDQPERPLFQVFGPSSPFAPPPNDEILANEDPDARLNETSRLIHFDLKRDEELAKQEQEEIREYLRAGYRGDPPA